MSDFGYYITFMHATHYCQGSKIKGYKRADISKGCNMYVRTYI